MSPDQQLDHVGDAAMFTAGRLADCRLEGWRNPQIQCGDLGTGHAAKCNAKERKCNALKSMNWSMVSVSVDLDNYAMTESLIRDHWALLGLSLIHI